MKNVVIIVILCFSYSSYSQVGDLEVSGYYDYSSDYNSFKLIRNDSVYRSGSVDYEVYEDSIPVGEYILEFYRNEDLIMVYYDIQIQANTRTYLYVSSPSYYTNGDGYKDSIVTSKGEVAFSFKLGDVISSKNNSLIEDHFEISENFNYFGVTKYASIGYSAGINYSWSIVSSDTSFSSYPPYKNERFTYFSFSNGVILRLTGYNNKKYFNHGPVIDIGAYYNFPISFRHVAVSGHTKSRTNRLHRFNDVSSFIKIGYYPVVLTLDYRFFDFVKPGYTQLPKFKVGISISIGTD